MQALRVCITLLLSNSPYLQTKIHFNIHFQVFNSIPIHAFQLWISVLLSLPLQPGLFSRRGWVNFLIRLFSLVSLLAKHKGLLHTALSSCPMILNTFFLAIADCALSFFRLSRSSLITCTESCSICWVPTKNRTLPFLPANGIATFVLIVVTPYQLQLPLFQKKCHKA